MGSQGRIRVWLSKMRESRACRDAGLAGKQVGTPLTYTSLAVKETVLETVVETEEFVRLAKALLSDAEHAALIDYVSMNPDVGLPLGAGIRKFRFARLGGGKSGGYRVIHYYKSDSDAPAILLVIYAKNVKDNLTPPQLLQLKALGEAIAASFRRRK